MAVDGMAGRAGQAGKDMNVFALRDGFADHAQVGSRLLYEAGPRRDGSRVSIVIPTYRRVDLLLETLESAMAQDAAIPCEIVIVSNDDDAGNSAIVSRLPREPRHMLRMYANDRNIGMFPNWNRGIELARGQWITILNDDDVLHPDFMTVMMQRIDARPDVDGLVCRTGFLDRRAEPARAGQPKSLFRTIWRMIARQRYDRLGMARVFPRHLFFGNELSNTLGFVVRREHVQALGGFRTEDAPSADYLFYARFAARYGLFVLNEVLADVGVGENESLKVETLIGFMEQGDRLRRDMADEGHVPAGWLRMGPLIVATAVAETNRFWHGQLDPLEIAGKLGIELPPPSRTRLNLLRLLHRAL
jgi:hypothetical protein